MKGAKGESADTSDDQKRDLRAHLETLKKPGIVFRQSSPQYCSFCGAKADELRLLIAGPTVFICDGCITLCMGIVAENDPELFEQAVTEARIYASAPRESGAPHNTEPQLPT